MYQKWDDRLPPPPQTREWVDNNNLVVDGETCWRDIEKSPARDERSSVCSCSRSNLVYVSETRPLLADVGFEKADD